MPQVPVTRVEISATVLGELEEVFCNVSHSNNVEGYVFAPRLPSMIEAIGLELPQAQSAYFTETKEEKVYFETFVKLANACAQTTESFMDNEMVEAFKSMAGRAGAAGSDETVIDGYLVQHLLTNLGEHVDNNDVDEQLNDELLKVNADAVEQAVGMRLARFKDMVRMSKPELEETKKLHNKE